jgi:hypothetical protein
MPEKAIVLTAVYGYEVFIMGVFTSHEKLKAYLDHHPQPGIPGLPLAEYDEPGEFKVDAE